MSEYITVEHAEYLRLCDDRRCLEAATRRLADYARDIAERDAEAFHLRENNARLRDEAAERDAELATARARTDEYADAVLALEAEVSALAPHGTCACSYDTPTDRCMHHSPALVAAEAERDAARAALTESEVLRAADAICLAKVYDERDEARAQLERTGAEVFAARHDAVVFLAQRDEARAALSHREGETRNGE